MNTGIYRLPQATFDYIDKKILKGKKTWKVVGLIKLTLFPFNFNFSQIQLKLIWQLRLNLFSLNKKRRIFYYKEL